MPEASGGFCGRGGRFGAHSSNESMAPVFYKKLAFIAFFNAGVRALDIRDPYHPKEVGYFIPSITEKTDKRCVGEGEDHCKVAIQTNNLETDERGYVYAQMDVRGAANSVFSTATSRKTFMTSSNGSAIGRGRTAKSAASVNPISACCNGGWRSVSRHRSPASPPSTA